MRNLIIGFIIVVLYSTTSVWAQSDNCLGLDSYCGGENQIPIEDRCYPTIESISANIVDYNSITGTTTFSVSVSGSGYSGYSDRFSIGFYVIETVINGNDTTIYDRQLSGGCSKETPGLDCVSCNAHLTYTTSTGSIPNGSTIRFYAEAREWVNNVRECYCTVYGEAFTISSSPDVLTVDEDPRVTEIGPSPCETRVGDPINVTNGNMFLERTDVVLENDNGFPIVFKRYYNSHGTGGKLGSNWQHSYEIEFTSDSLGNPAFREGNGHLIIFSEEIKNGQTYYTSNYGKNYEYEYIDNPFPETDFKRVTRDNGTVVTVAFGWEYPPNGHSEVDIHGNMVGVMDDSNYIPWRIIDGTGRYIELDHDIGEPAPGQLQNIKDSLGNVLVSYYYDASDRLEKVIYATSDTEKYIYSTETGQEHLIIRTEKSNGVVWNYEYNVDGLADASYGERVGDTLDLERVDITYTSSCYPPPCAVTSEVTHHYDGVNSSTTTYTSTWDPGFTTRLLSGVTDPACPSCGSEYERDGRGNLEVIEYKNGLRDSLFYDYDGNLLLSVKAANTSASKRVFFENDLDFRLPVLTWYESLIVPDSMDSISYAYDANGNLETMIEKVWDSVGYLSSYTTDFTYTDNSLTFVDGPRTDVSDTTLLEYYSNGDLKIVGLANGVVYEFGQRDLLGKRTWVAGPHGDTTRYVFDTRGRLNSIANHAGWYDSIVTSYTYDFEGNLTKITYPEGNFLEYDYDNHGWLTSIVNSVGDNILYSYNANSNRIGMSIKSSDDVETMKEFYEYDEKDQLRKIYSSHADTTTTIYLDVMGNVDSVIAENGNKIAYFYDLQNRIDSVSRYDGLDSSTTRFLYDYRDNLVELTDPDGYEYVFEYDDRGLLIYDSSGITGVTTYEYDPSRNLIEKNDGIGNTTTYVYDALNRLTDIVFPADTFQNVYYLYDDTTGQSHGLGRLYKETGPSGDLEYIYNSYGHVQEEIRTVFDTSYSTAYTYNKNGGIGTMTHPSGLKVMYFVDEVKRVKKATWLFEHTAGTLVDSVQYAPFGDITSMVYGNSIDTQIDYNQKYLIDRIFTADIQTSQTVDSLNYWLYDYNNVANITGIEDSLDSDKSRAFGYDDLDRLTSYSSTDIGGTLGFGYTGNSNRSYFKSGTDSTAYYYNNNKLDSISGPNSITYGYNDLGNVTADYGSWGQHSFQYDLMGRMITIDNDTLKRSGYDSRSLRIKKQNGSNGDNWRAMLYNQSGQLSSEMRWDNKWICDYVYLNGKLLAKVESAIAGGGAASAMGGGMTLDGIGDPPPPPPGRALVNVYWYHLDHLGTPWKMTDSAKTIRWEGEYYPFGKLYSETVSEENPHRLPGQYEDDGTDMYYNWHRFYDPEIGRYRQSDPIGLAGGVNQFGYVGGNPLTYIDPLG